MAVPELFNNIKSAAEYIVYYMGLYHSVMDYEVQTGAIAEPTTASKGNGHIVVVYNSDLDRVFLWVRCNGDTDWQLASDEPGQFFPATNTNGNFGTYDSVRLTDGVDVLTRMTIQIPNSIATVSSAFAFVIPEASGNMRRSVTTNFAAVGETYQTHTDSIAAGEVAVTQDELEPIDLSDALTGIVAGDFLGVAFTRHGSHASDTVDADCHFLGILIIGA